jgi:hypothetical protein
VDRHRADTEDVIATGEQSGLDQIWIPRIGPEATAELRRGAPLTVFMGAVVIAAAIGSSFAFGTGSPVGWLLGILCVGCAVAIIAVWISSRRKLARAMSQWFGVTIGWHEIPRMTATQFDDWCQRRGLTSPNR